MILRERVPLRLPRLGLFLIAVIALVALPAWSQRAVEQGGGGTRIGISLDPNADWETVGDVLSKTRMEVMTTRQPLPADAQEILQKYEKRQAEARREMESRLAQSRQEAIKQLRDLQDSYTKAGKLDEAVAIRDRVRKLESAE